MFHKFHFKTYWKNFKRRITNLEVQNSVFDVLFPETFPEGMPSV